MAITTTVTGFTAALGNPGVDLAWDAVAGATKYELWYYPSNATEATRLTEVAGGVTAAKHSNVAAETTYHYTIRAGDADGWGPYLASADKPEVTTPEAPGEPSSVSATAQSSSSIRVTWNAPASGGAPTQYWVGHGTSTSTIRTFVATSPYTITGLAEDTGYVIRVVAVNASGIDPAPDIWVFTPADTTVSAPGAPSSVSASTVDHDSITVSWSAPTSGGSVDSYSIRYRKDGTSTWSAVTGRSGTSYTVNSLEASTTYEFQVQAVNSGGASAWTPSTPVGATTDAAPVTRPAAPGGLALGSATGSSLTASWNSVTGATGYDLQYRVANTGGWSALNNVTSPRAITGLAAGTSYEVQVRAKNSAGTSAWSASVTAGTSAVAGPSAPAGETVRVISGVPFAYMAGTGSGGSGTLTYSLPGRPAWIAFDAATRTVSGTPTAPGATTLAYTVTDANGNSASATLTIDVRAPEADADSVFHADHTNVTQGVALKSVQMSAYYADDTAAAVDSRHPGNRSTQPIDFQYIVNGDTAYLALLFFDIDGDLHLHLSGDVDAGPQFTSAALDDLGLAVRLADGTVYKWRLDNLRLGDAAEPYRWIPSVVQDAGDEITAALRQSLRVSMTQVVLLDRADANINWETLTVGTSTDMSGSSATPSPPRRFRIDSRSTGVVMSWLAPLRTGTGGAVTGYNIWRHDGSSWSEIAVDTGSADTAYTDTAALPDGERYEYVVRAVNAAGEGEWSQVLDVIINPSLPSAPRRFSADARSTGVVMSWLAPVDAGKGGAVSGYSIWRHNGSAWREIVADTGTTALSYVDTDALETGARYEYGVRARNAAGVGEWSATVNVVINPELPSAPRRVTASARGSNAELTWLAPADEGSGGAVTSYRIWRNRGAGWSQFAAVAGAMLTYTDGAPQAAGATYYAVQAVNAAGAGEWSAVASTVMLPAAMAGPAVPSAPRRFAADSQSTGVVLTWLAPAESGTGGAVSGYNVWRNDGAGWSQIEVNTGSAALTYTDDDSLDAGATYSYAVRAVNAAGAGEWSETSDAVINPELPAAPRRLTASVRGTGVALTWLAPLDSGTGGAVTGYVILRNTGSGWVVIEADTGGAGTAYTDGTTPAAGATAYAVRAINAAGTGEWSEAANAVKLPAGMAGPAVPGAPRQLSADARSSGVVLTWLAPAESGSGGAVTGYNVWRNGGSGWVEIEADSGDARKSYTDDDTLTEGARYEYVVRAVNASGTGEWSAVIAVVINPALPSAPRRLTVDARSAGVVLDWLAPLDSGSGGPLTGYTILRNDGGGWTVIEADTGDTFLTYTDDDALVEGATYSYVVRARSALGPGEWSATVSAVINPALPSAPRRFSADARPAGVVLGWLAPLDSGSGGPVTGYNIWRYDGNWTEIVVDTGSTGLAYTDTAALVEGAYYEYAVRARNASGPGEWSEVVKVLINPSVPSAPRRFTADSRSTGVVLDWLAPVDDGSAGPVTGYNIWRYDGVWTEIVADTGGTGTAYTDTATLEAGRIYKYALRARNSAGGGDWSEVFAVRINPALPSAPRRLIASEAAAGIVLRWEAPVDDGLGGAVSNYEIWRFTTVWTLIATIGDALTYTDAAALTPGWHWWSVIARNAAGRGEVSDPVGVTTAVDVPGPPGSLYAVETQAGVQLAWSAPLDDGGSAVSGYRIWRSDGSGWVELVADSGSTDTTYLDAMVLTLGDGLYFYRVNALTAAGPGDFSAAAAVQLGAQVEGTAEAPTGLTAVLGADGSVDLSWVAPFDSGVSAVSGYSVQCWTPQTLWSVCVADTGSTLTAYTLARAVASGVNLFRVAALTDAGVGEWSLPASVLVERLFGPEGGRKTLGASAFYAPTLIAPPAVRYPVVLRDRHGHALPAGGLYDLQPEWWSWTAQGGSDSAVVQAAAPGRAALLHALDWLDHDLLILQPGTGQVLWSGYVNSVTVPVGDFGLRRSLAGYANDLRVLWTRPPRDGEGAVDFVHSARNAEAAWQRARFGVRSALVKSDRTLVELDQDDVDRLLAEYQNAVGTARMEGGLPAGVRLECRGHAGRLDQRFFPTRAAGQYGSVTERDDDHAERVQYSIANNPASPHGAIYQYADLNPLAGYGHGPRSPAWEQYLRRVRFWEARRVGDTSKQRFRLGLYALGSGDAPGAALTAATVAVGHQTQYTGVPRSPAKAPLAVDWVADGDPLTRLPAGGWYFGLEDDAGLHENGFDFDRAAVRYWPDGRNNGRLLVRREIGSGAYTAQLDHLSFDFFTGVTAEGLARWLASDPELGRGVLAAHPANAAAGVYGAQVAQYFQGDVTWREPIDQLAYADRLCYAVDEQRMLRFWSADGPGAEPLAWTGGGANLGAFIGRRLLVEGEAVLLTGASYDAMNGQVDYSSPGKPSATVGGWRLGNIVG